MCKKENWKVNPVFRSIGKQSGESLESVVQDLHPCVHAETDGRTPYRFIERSANKPSPPLRYHCAMWNGTVSVHPSVCVINHGHTGANRLRQDWLHGFPGLFTDTSEMKGLGKILRVSRTPTKTIEWVLNKAGVKRQLLDTVKAS